MNKLSPALFLLAVAFATTAAHSQAPQAAQAQAPQAAQVQAAPAAQKVPPINDPAAPMGAKSLEAKMAMCIGCHGINGYQASFPEVYKVPMISGQNAKYIVAALNAYKTGDRKHPTMRGVSAGLSDQDMADMGAYYEAHGREPGKTLSNTATPVPPAPQVAALLQKAACTSCHGANLSTPIDPGYPKIAGQHKDYLFVALKAYKAENNPVVGRNNAVMSAIAKQYSNAELKVLANYVASLDSELKSQPVKRLR